MRWIESISFSSSSPSSSSPKPILSSSSSSAAAASVDETVSPRKRHSGRSRSNLLGGGAALASLVGCGAAGGGGGGGVGGTPKLTRQRKLRHLTDQDVVGGGAKSVPVLSMDTDVLPRSVSAPFSNPPSSARLSTSVPVPLPLPLPVPENSNSGDGELRLPSPPMERDRDRADGGGERICSSPSISPSTRANVSQDIRKMPDNRATRPSRLVLPESNNVDSARDNRRFNGPVRSAPSSPFTSPLRGQQKNIAVSDLFLFRHNIPKGSQVWSAPEMALLDIAGLPPPAYIDIGAFSSENSPLHSPRTRSPRWNPRSLTGPASPLHAKLLSESSTARRENNGNLGVHPLPLPPGAVVHSPSSPVPQVITKPEATLKSQWQKGKLIGRGTFGSVYVASNRETGALCAMKEVEIFPDDPKSAESIKQLEQEIKVLSQLKHPNIVQYYGSEIVEDRFYIYLEYVHPGSINKYVQEHCGAITESVVRSFTRHILSGLAYLHSTKTIHRDIKGANLLVDASGVVKLADFGMAKHLTGQVSVLSLKGSPYWMAPELMQAVMQKDTSSDLALAVDIWSLGCTIIEMFNGKPPWSEYEGAAAMFKVLRDTPPVPETLSAEGKDFLSCCFRRNPAERPTASRLLEHCWLKHSQQGDMQCSTQSTCPMRLMDMPHSPRSSDVKLDRLPTFQISRTVKGKLASDSSSFMHHSFSPARLANDLSMKLST